MASDKQHAVTLQVAALSTVHTALADDEKRGLKRKLAKTQKSLAIVSAELHEQTKKEAEIYEHSFDGFQQIQKVIGKMHRASNHGTTEMHLSNAEVCQLLDSLAAVRNRFSDNISTVVIPESSGEEDEDTGEQ